MPAHNAPASRKPRIAHRLEREHPMIHIAIATKDSSSNPKGTLSALRAHLTRAQRNVSVLEEITLLYDKAFAAEQRADETTDEKQVDSFLIEAHGFNELAGLKMQKHGLCGKTTDELLTVAQGKVKALQFRISEHLKENPDLATAATTTKRRSVSRAKRFQDDDGNVDRAAIMARYNEHKESINRHVRRLFLETSPAPLDPSKLDEALIESQDRPNDQALNQLHVPCSNGDGERCVTTDAVFSEIEAKPVTIKATSRSKGRDKTKAA